MAYLSNFRIDEVPYKKSQSESFKVLARELAAANADCSEDDFIELLQKVGAKPPEIEFRSHYLPTFRLLSEAKIEERMRFFDEVASAVFDRLMPKQKAPFQELFHVTCTGYQSPSPAQKWVTESRAFASAKVTHLYHMGCYASLPAVRLAGGMAALNRTVEICHTELCTLHLNLHKPKLEDLCIQTLFADGACAYRVSPQKPHEKALRYLSAHEEIIPETLRAMHWGIQSAQFKMGLSKDVPSEVKKALPEILQRWLGEDFDLKNKKILWAIHPGGPKILDEIEASLGLAREQLRHSRKVLRERGNLSSATLPHIWKEILEDFKVRAGTPILTMAFGPGLTISLARLEVCE